MPEQSETSRFETDEFLTLLTDALRAGPASPQWHEAVARLRNSGILDSNEYHLLFNARENLESGREYRTIRAGPEFTRKVMNEIEQEAAGKAPALAPTSALIALGAIGIGALVILAILMLYRTSGTTGSIAQLEALYFIRPVISIDFDQKIGPEWVCFGQAPEISNRSKGLKAVQKKDASGYQSGGILASTGISSAEPFSFEIAVRVPEKLDQTLLQIFVSDAASDKIDGRHEFACYFKDGQFSVVKPDGSLNGRSFSARELNHVVIKIDSRFAIVEVEGIQLFAGAHGLDTNALRYPGIRFISKAQGSADDSDDITVQSIKILKP
jgi:hypothetical protein